MEITGIRVRCANCGMIYDRLPSDQAYWIGVPFRVNGSLVCLGCGSNAYDVITQPTKTITTNATNEIIGQNKSE